jgi:hypothetical protein
MRSVRYILFVDFKAAYDSIDRNEIFKAMEEFSLPEKLRRLVEVTFSITVKYK